MNYIYVDFESYKYWIEVDGEGNALRQVTINPENTAQVSCLEPCLADQFVDTKNDCEAIDVSEFEVVWQKYTLSYRENWNEQKEKYTIGMPISAPIKYFYPQGAILDLGSVQGCAKIYSLHKNILYPENKIRGVVSGYDEKNMWVLIRVH